MVDKIDKLDDQMISRFTRSVKYKIPEAVEERVTTALTKEKKGKTMGPVRSRVWFPLSVSAAAAAVIIAAIFIFQPFLNNRSEPVTPITEIKTEFELNDKNIKILWVQKKDFDLKLRK